MGPTSFEQLVYFNYPSQTSFDLPHIMCWAKQFFFSCMYKQNYDEFYKTKIRLLFLPEGVAEFLHFVQQGGISFTCFPKKQESFGWPFRVWGRELLVISNKLQHQALQLYIMNDIIFV